ncbi:hypothetical protein [Virgisporangium aurantiacum]|uniref:Thioesterase domain-containing protein n=1 Tax=Virgisporangium aurantiacum TaxID=175570 RepID=A0A8J4DXP7_9ACTN|nr:hypothetical protein [Virgisporangium aurantiacum]GIJ54775.1 hypothetical protein Vau01_022910 [Virgisporangium aurantiacum]
MHIPEAHSVLRKSDTGDLVVAADFGSAGRPSATFTELVAGLRAEHTVWETMPPPHGTEVGRDGKWHVDRWVRDIRAAELPVRAVIGFCSGSVYAGALVREISAWQRRPRLILIDPDRAERFMVTNHYEQFVRARLGVVMPAEEVDDAVRAGRAADETCADPLDLAAELGVLCRRYLPPAARQAGMSGPRSVELAEIFSSYLYWLAAGSTVDGRREWATATALNSNTDGFGLDAFPEAERADLVAEVVQFDVSHRELMRDPDVHRTVDGLLQEGD